jgi:hypothetical protein
MLPLWNSAWWPEEAEHKQAAHRLSLDGRPMPWPWEEWRGQSMAWVQHGYGTASVNQIRPHSVNQMGKTHSKPLAARHGRGTAWARHVMCESAFSVLCNTASTSAVTVLAKPCDMVQNLIILSTWIHFYSCALQFIHKITFKMSTFYVFTLCHTHTHTVHYLISRINLQLCTGAQFMFPLTRRRRAATTASVWQFFWLALEMTDAEHVRTSRNHSIFHVEEILIYD